MKKLETQNEEENKIVTSADVNKADGEKYVTDDVDKENKETILTVLKKREKMRS